MPDTHPYRSAAGDYWAAGWRGILPIPANSKRLALRGWTGHEGKTPSFPDVYAWSEGVEGDGNIALRMPPNIVGIDVDDYGSKTGAETIEAFERAHGPLPSTWRSTARPGGRSGIYFYTVPVGLRWPGQLGPNVEIVQFSHRYAVVWPSINPDAQAGYFWYPPMTYVVDSRTGLAARTHPTVDELPALPAAWVEALTGGLALEVEHKAAIAYGGVARWIEASDYDGDCRQMAYAVAQGDQDFGTGSRHDVLNSVIMRIIRLADGGHRGLRRALSETRGTFERVTSDGSRDGTTLDGEWDRSVEGAVAKVIGSDTRPDGARCDPCSCNDDPRSLVPTDYAGPIAFDAVGGPPAQSEGRFAGRILTVDQLRNLPPLEPLIVDTIERSTIFMVAGDFGTYKSFLVLDWLACLSSGRPWMGREVPKPVRTLYVCGEGASGIGKRMNAWELSRLEPLTGFFVLPVAVNLGDLRQVADLAIAMRHLAIGLVVFDTLNRCTSGLEENSAKDMGIVIDNLSRLRDVNDGGTVGVIHHTGKDGSRERGSSALADGVDTLYIATGGHGDPMQLERRKRKDGEERDEHTFRLRLVPGTDSGVLDPIGIEDTFPARSLHDLIIRTFVSVFYAQGGASRSTLREALPESTSRQAFHKAMGVLISTGRLVNHGTDKLPFYRLGIPQPGDRWTAGGVIIPGLE